MTQNKSTKFMLSLAIFHFGFSQGCALSSPFRGPAYKSDSSLSIVADQKVVVAVTNAKLNKSKYADDFNERSRDIYKNIEENPGYLGGSVRFKLFGNEVWTLTVWKDKESLIKFLDARRHSDAMYMTNAAMTEFKHFNFETEFKNIPRNWKLIDEMLAQRSYQKHVPF